MTENKQAKHSELDEPHYIDEEVSPLSDEQKKKQLVWFDGFKSREGVLIASTPFKPNSFVDKFVACDLGVAPRSTVDKMTFWERWNKLVREIVRRLRR